MGIVEYFRGRRIRLRSPLRQDEIAERINAASGSRWNPFGSGVKGGVALGRINLFNSPWGAFSYNAMPVLAGRLEQKQGRTEIDATYRAPIWVYAFFIFWYGFLSLFAVAFIGLGMSGELEPGAAMGLIVFPLLLGAPIAMHYLFGAFSEQSLDDILHMLEREADLTRLV